MPDYSNRDDQSVPDILKTDSCVIADTLNMLYLMESQQFKTGKVGCLFKIADSLNMLYLMESQQFKTGKVG